MRALQGRLRYSFRHSKGAARAEECEVRSDGNGLAAAH
jgi:hypothetical protein